MISINELLEKKKTAQKISMVTAYDLHSARIVDEAGIDLILVGDSLGMVIQGKKNTLPVTMDEMIYHSRIVSSTALNAMIIGDMPFLSYQVSTDDAVRNAGRFLKEAGVNAVKLEGGRAVRDKIAAIVNADIPVMGHIGLTPQSIQKLGKYSVQGKSKEEQKKIMADAKAVEEAGAFAVVLECVPAELAGVITEKLSIPTIGVGAGPHCDGQVLVFHDIVGLTTGRQAKFVKQYANLYQDALGAVKTFKKEVEEETYPSNKESYLS